MITKLRNFIFSITRRLPLWTTTTVCSVAILYLTLVPKPLPENDLGLIPGLDKVVHGIMFMGLSLCIMLDMAERDRRRGDIYRPRYKRAVIVTLIVTACGGAIELCQSAMQIGRSGDWVDLLADAAGALTGAMVAIRLLRRP